MDIDEDPTVELIPVIKYSRSIQGLGGVARVGIHYKNWHNFLIFTPFLSENGYRIEEKPLNQFFMNCTIRV